MSSSDSTVEILGNCNMFLILLFQGQKANAMPRRHSSHCLCMQECLESSAACCEQTELILGCGGSLDTILYQSVGSPQGRSCVHVSSGTAQRAKRAAEGSQIGLVSTSCFSVIWPGNVLCGAQSRHSQVLMDLRPSHGWTL